MTVNLNYIYEFLSHVHATETNIQYILATNLPFQNKKSWPKGSPFKTIQKGLHHDFTVSAPLRHQIG